MSLCLVSDPYVSGVGSVSVRDSRLGVVLDFSFVSFVVCDEGGRGVTRHSCE